MVTLATDFLMLYHLSKIRTCADHDPGGLSPLSEVSCLENIPVLDSLHCYLNAKPSAVGYDMVLPSTHEAFIKARDRLFREAYYQTLGTSTEMNAFWRLGIYSYCMIANEPYVTRFKDFCQPLLQRLGFSSFRAWGGIASEDYWAILLTQQMQWSNASGPSRRMIAWKTGKPEVRTSEHSDSITAERMIDTKII